MTIRLHRGDLPDISRYKGSVAVDTEAMGLDVRRDRLCVIQLSPGDGSADVVQIPAANINALRTGTGNQRLLVLALVIWPIMAGVPAFIIALVIAAVLERLRPNKELS